jgi:uncharacterized protein (DUF2345 family)
MAEDDVRKAWGMVRQAAERLAKEAARLATEATGDDVLDAVKRHQEPSHRRHRKPSHPGHADAPAGAGAALDLSSPDRRFSRRR